MRLSPSGTCTRQSVGREEVGMCVYHDEGELRRRRAILCVCVCMALERNDWRERRSLYVGFLYLCIILILNEL